MKAQIELQKEVYNDLQKKVIELVECFEHSKKPGQYIDGLNNYERHLLRVGVGYKKNFPKTWKKQI